jgi:flagellin
MTRINTNVSALIAEQNLNNSNNSLQTTLTRLSTGLRINSAADDPAGMIAATDLGANIAASNQAISNSQVASQMISTADSALSQISSLLTTINGLVTESANTSSESSSQVAANQLQIDSSLSAINSIAQTTKFQGQNLLDGSLAFQTTGGTNSAAIQNLQVSQVNFGTSSSIPVDINVTALAQQAQIVGTVNDGLSSDATASSTVTFNDGSTITVQAPGSGAGANGIRVAFNESSTIAAGTATAAFDAATQTLNVTVSNTGTTSGQTIADAINNDTTFKATPSSSLASKGFVAGTDTTAQASTTISTADAGSLSVASLTPGVGGQTVTFTEGNATNGPTVSVDSSGNLNVTINDATHAGGQTSLASIAQAINAYKNADGQQVFSANVTNGGFINTAVNAATGLAADGFGAPQAETPSSTTITGAAAGTLVLDAVGAEANGALIQVNQVVGADSATWNAAANGGKGKLTLNLSTTGGAANNGIYTKANLTTLVATAAGSPFTVDASTTGLDALTDVTNTISQSATVSGGADGWVHNAAALALAGQGVGGVLSAGSGASGLAANLVLQVGGTAGSQLFTFNAGTTAAQIATALNQASEATGVQAMAIGDQLVFNSTGYGSAATASVQVVNEGTGGTFGSSLSATNATGSDIKATVNGVAATGQGNTVSLNTPSLGFSADLDPTQVTGGENIDFNVTGGGALFQLGPQVTSNQQVNLGIASATTASLGGTVGRLYQIGSGNNASLTANSTLAGQIVQAALNSVTSLRGQLGAFQTATVDSNISTLTNAVTNLTAAQSDIQDADFASESASLTKQQILVQSGTTVLGVANSNPANVLTLLQKASQV